MTLAACAAPSLRSSSLTRKRLDQEEVEVQPFFFPISTLRCWFIDGWQSSLMARDLVKQQVAP